MSNIVNKYIVAENTEQFDIRYSVLMWEYDEFEEEPIFRHIATCSNHWDASYIVKQLRIADDYSAVWESNNESS